MSWIWLTRDSVEAFHDAQLRRHGGLPGLRDENALEAALARPLNKANYGDPDIYELAAAYLYDLAMNHAFNDGNKRTAIVAAGVFVMSNGREITADDFVVYQFVMDVAAGLVSEESAARWFRDCTAPRP